MGGAAPAPGHGLKRKQQAGGAVPAPGRTPERPPILAEGVGAAVGLEGAGAEGVGEAVA